MGGSAKLGWRVYGGGSAALAGIGTRKAVTTVWKLFARRDPPGEPAHPDVPWREALGWSLVSGVVVATARLLATRQAALAWRRASGKLPPGMDEAD